MNIFEKLRAPFHPSRISWRVGSTTKDKTKGLAFGYIDARDVMERLDDVCGPENWQCSYPHANGKTICSIGIRVRREGEGFEWIWKSDGAGDSDVEAEKGAMSDAFKRAAVRFGIGRYLYDIPATWVEIEAAGNSYKIKQAEYAKLERILGGQKPQPKQVAITAEKGAEKQSIMPEDFAARNEFMVSCREKIETFTDAGLLGGWWNGDEQKELRRKHQLDSTQVEGLKQAVIKRKQFLEAKQRAA